MHDDIVGGSDRRQFLTRAGKAGLGATAVGGLITDRALGAGKAAAKPKSTADLPGEYEVELTISNANGQSKDKVLITATVIEPIVIDAGSRASGGFF